MAIAVVGTELGGVFSSIWRFRVRDQIFRISVEMQDLEGRAVGDIQAGASFLRSFGYPNRLRLSPQYSPVTEALEDIPELALPTWVAIARVVDDLMTLQSVTNEPIRFPSLDDLTPEKQSEIRRFARIVQGEILEGTWGDGEFTVTLHDDRELPDPSHVFGILYAKDLVLELGQQHIAIGAATVEIPFAKRSSEFRLSDGGSRTIGLTPIPENNTVWMRLDTFSNVAIGQVFMRRVGSLVGRQGDHT